MTGLQNISPTLELLLRARERLSDPKMWTQVPSGECGDALCMGMTLVRLGGACNATHDAIDAIKRHTGGEIPALTHWNDTHTHAEMLALLDRVISEMVC